MMDFNSINDICNNYGAEFIKNTPIAPYTSFKIGGECNIIYVNGINVLKEITRHCKDNLISFRILGRGSNVLISDKGLDGVVLLIGADFSNIDVEGEVVKCQAGAKLSDICRAAALHSLTGMEFAYGIPGTVGGALYMNAGAYGGEMSQVVESCSYLDIKSGEIKQINVDEMMFSYRHSIFCEKEWVITKVRLRLKKGSRTAVKIRMDEITTARREKQPLEFPSAGSIFKRPQMSSSADAVQLYAAKLIDDCGLKGKSIGGSQVSEKHAGFIINKGGAAFVDVVKLIQLIKEEVHKQTSVTLECEIKVWE